MINIKKLKDNLDNNIDVNLPIIFKYDNSSEFLIYQYLNKISEIKEQEIIYLSTIDEIREIKKSKIDPNFIYFLKVDSLEDIELISNLIIACKEILINRKEIENLICGLSPLKQWHLLDYAKNRLGGLEDSEVEWLCNICKYNPYRVDIEISKIAIFNKSTQPVIFKGLNNNRGYLDLNKPNIFNISNALLKKDRESLKDALLEYQEEELNPLSLVSLLQTNIKNILNMQLQPYKNASQLGINPKQFYVLKYNIGFYTNEELIKIYDIINSIDMQLKQGFLPLKLIIDYLILNMMIG